MYGGSDSFGNKMVLSIKSRIVNILDVKKGESVGYDRSFYASKKMKIAVVPIGYADGLDRGLSNNFSLLIGGVKCKIVGKICMDVCMVDITDLNVGLYDEVVILGKQKRQSILLQDYAEALETSPYEILLKFNYSRMNYIEI
jgi:alanine racemase